MNKNDTETMNRNKSMEWVTALERNSPIFSKTLYFRKNIPTLQDV